MKKITKHFILLAMAINLLSCLSGQKNAKIEWRLGVNAPKDYPIIIASGGLSNGSKSASLTTRADINDGWGQGGLEMSTSYFIPNKLSVKWFSYAEDKFYGGTFSLPEDTISTLMKQGYTRPNGKLLGYYYIFVNMYPKGGVALWAKAPGKRCVEIGHFQAKEIDYDWINRRTRFITRPTEQTTHSNLGLIPFASLPEIKKEPMLVREDKDFIPFAFRDSFRLKATGSGATEFYLILALELKTSRNNDDDEADKTDKPDKYRIPLPLPNKSGKTFILHKYKVEIPKDYHRNKGASTGSYFHNTDKCKITKEKVAINTLQDFYKDEF